MVPLCFPTRCIDPTVVVIMPRSCGKNVFRNQKIWRSCSFSPGWIRFALAVAIAYVASRHTTTLVVRASSAVEQTAGVEALDSRVDAALRLFETSDPTAGEAELKDIAEWYPSYAKAPFYLGLLSQSRGEPETAVGFYAAAVRAGSALVVVFSFLAFWFVSPGEAIADLR